MYLGKVKISLDRYPIKYQFGITVLPRYKQFEINLGTYVLCFWLRNED